jgi:hypothetical protein
MRTLLLNQDGIAALAHADAEQGLPRYFTLETQREFRDGGEFVIAGKQGRVVAK